MDMSVLLSGPEMIGAWSLIALPMSVLVLCHLCFQHVVDYLVRKVRCLIRKGK